MAYRGPLYVKWFLSVLESSTLSKSLSCTTPCRLQKFGWQAAAEFCSLLNNTARAVNTKVSPSLLASYSLAARDLHQDYDIYRVKVVTGSVRGAGTTASALVQLIGSQNTSERFVIGDSEDVMFTRGSQRTFDLPIPKDLGTLRRIYVQRSATGFSELGAGWFLDQVEVHGPQGEYWLFPCHAWFGQSDCRNVDGALERNLLPSAGEEQIAPQPVKIAAAGYAIPHPEKVKHRGIKGVNRRNFGFGGEDAYFYCQGRHGIFGMGVADGVYGWREKGIDAGIFSRTLMETSLHMVQAGCEDVVKVLHTAARHVESEGVFGSSTVCLLTINQATGRMHAANLGDSGLLLIGLAPGDDQVKFRTPQLEHEFGRPFQLGSHAAADKPDAADMTTLPVRKGDVLVMGSDGLLDNLSDADILDMVVSLRAKGMAAGEVAKRLLAAAHENSLDKHKGTPYSEAATEAFDMVYSGGKPDDITVLVAVVD